MPAPSPITKPFRSLSNGIEARFGSSEVLSAVSCMKPATPIGVMQASAPPASMISASPCAIVRNASPTLCVPEAQAVTMLMFLPFSPHWIATLPAAMLLIIIGTNSGLTMFGPLVIMRLYSRSTDCREPMPDPIAQPAM